MSYIPLQHQTLRLLDERLDGWVLLDGVRDLDETALRPRDVTLDDDYAELVVDLEHAEVLHRDPLVAHATRHLLARMHTRTAALAGTRGTDGPVILGVTVTGLLAGEAVPLHATGEAHAAAVAAGVDELADPEPVGRQLDADGEQALLAADLELGEVPLRRDALGLVVPEQGGRRVVGRLIAAAHLHGPVPVLGARLGGHDLALVDLENGAGRPRALLGVEHGRHALLDGHEARPHGRRLGLALQGGGGPGGGSRETRGYLVEPVRLAARRRGRPAVFDAALGCPRQQRTVRCDEDSRCEGGRGGCEGCCPAGWQSGCHCRWERNWLELGFSDGARRSCE